MTDDLQKLLDAATKGPWRVGNSLYPSQCIMAGDTLIATHINSVNSPLMALAPTLAARVIAAEKMRHALTAAMKFIADEYSDPAAQALEGEYLEKTARPIFSEICAALAQKE